MDGQGLVHAKREIQKSMVQLQNESQEGRTEVIQAGEII